MLYVCTACRYMFEKDDAVTQCPDCGKYAVQAALPDEIREYEARKLIKDDWFDQQPMSYTQIVEDMKNQKP